MRLSKLRAYAAVIGAKRKAEMRHLSTAPSARYGLLAAAILLALVVNEYALFFRPSATSVLLGAAAFVILAAGS